MKRANPTLFALYPTGLPAIEVVGRAVNLRLFIPGCPVAKGRVRARVIQGKKPFAQFYTPQETKVWEQNVAEHARFQATNTEVTGEDPGFTLPFAGRAILKVRFNMPAPKSYSRAQLAHHVRKPDVDNLMKAVLDGLVMGRIIEDDNAITDLLAYKRYQTDDHPEGVEIDLTALA